MKITVTVIVTIKELIVTNASYDNFLSIYEKLKSTVYWTKISAYR